MIYGKSAVLKAWEQRQQDFIRVYLINDRIGVAKEILQGCVEAKKAYHIVSKDDLEKITNSPHHEGLAALINQRRAKDAEEFFHQFKKKNFSAGALLFVDGVSNPHNLGAICRSMAHFGVRYLMGKVGELPEESAAWLRTSEGGYEHIEVIRCKDKVAFLTLLKELGYRLVVLDQKASLSLYKAQLSEKSVFIVGHELHGISREVLAIAAESLKIDGTGQIESLNVSVATALCLSEWKRQQTHV